LLAIGTPIFVGFLLGPYAWALPAGMILSANCRVFMANAGGAWDNAKKTIGGRAPHALDRQGVRKAQSSVTAIPSAIRSRTRRAGDHPLIRS